MSSPAETNRYSTPAQAVAVAAGVPLTEPAVALLTPQHSPQDFIRALADGSHFTDAVRMIAAALPRREAIWWAAQCIRGIPALTADPKHLAALVAAETWAAQPTDEHRRAAFAAADVAGVSSPAGCAAIAAFLMEGSLAPAKLAAVAPPANAGPSTAGNAVVLAAVIAEPERAAEKYRAFLAIGDAVAAGTNRWNGAPTASPAATKPAAAPATTSGPKSYPPYPPPRR